MSRVHELLYNIKSMAERAESFIADQIDLLEMQAGWSPETIQARDMRNTAQALRSLAARIDNLRERMLSERSNG